MDVEHLINVPQMPPDTLDADAQPVHDFLVGKTAHDEVEDFAFTGRGAAMLECILIYNMAIFKGMPIGQTGFIREV